MLPERESEPWMGRARCAYPDVDTNIFFIGRGESAQPARDVCNRCPVDGECLDYALRTSPRGIWGGFTEGERQTLFRERAARLRKEEAARFNEVKRRYTVALGQQSIASDLRD